MLTPGSGRPGATLTFTFIFQTHTSWIHKAKLQSGYVFPLLFSSTTSPSTCFKEAKTQAKNKRRKLSRGDPSAACHLGSAWLLLGPLFLYPDPTKLNLKNIAVLTCGWNCQKHKEDWQLSLLFFLTSSFFCHFLILWGKNCSIYDIFKLVRECYSGGKTQNRASKNNKN